MPYDHVLLIGFGGPEKKEEVRPFLEEVSRGRNISSARLEEVARHYEAIGGRSPYTPAVRQLAEDLHRLTRLPVFYGMRNWHPFLKEVLPEIRKQNLKQGFAFILAPHRSQASYDRYLTALQEAGGPLHAADYEMAPAWHIHPLFIEAWVKQIKKILKPDSSLLFTAHSIPLSMAANCGYDSEIRASCERMVKSLGTKRWHLAYQSQSPRPGEAWLGPDLTETLKKIREEGNREAALAPVGFLCENAEILYDLDIAAKKEAEQMGLIYRRSACVLNEEPFARMIAGLTGLSSVMSGRGVAVQ